MSDGISDRISDDAPDDRLEELRARLGEVGSLALVERPAVFESVNEALVAELAVMEEV